MTTITRVEIQDIRFPTSRSLDGSDAMNPDPDYSAAYVVLKTDAGPWEGHGMAFTIGRGTDICVQTIEMMKLLFIIKVPHKMYFHVLEEMIRFIDSVAVLNCFNRIKTSTFEEVCFFKTIRMLHYWVLFTKASFGIL